MLKFFDCNKTAPLFNKLFNAKMIPSIINAGGNSSKRCSDISVSKMDYFIVRRF